MKNDKRKRWAGRAPAENCPQRILRKVLHENNAEFMEPRALYDVTVHAVMQDRNLTYKDLSDVATEMMRLDRRAMLAGERKDIVGVEISRRAAQEAEVLEWAMDEISAMLRPGNQYGRR